MTDQVDPGELVEKLLSKLETKGEQHQPQFSDEEIKALRSAALFIISARMAGSFFRVVFQIALWSSWVILALVAWKSGQLSQFLDHGPHP